MKKAVLATEEGLIFEGLGFGSEGEAFGEIVFNTALTGYQEIITDPSYNGQIVVMTYPEIGNYGINSEDLESKNPVAKGLVVKEYWPLPSNWRSEESLSNYMNKHNILGIHGIDTRQLTKQIRTKGAQKSLISTTDFDKKSLIQRVRKSPGVVGRDLVTEVSCKKSYSWSKGAESWIPAAEIKSKTKKKYNVVAYDFGIKTNILRRLTDLGCKLTVVPSKTDPNDILAMNPDGIFLSNGPGDPEGVAYAIENVNKLIGKKPIFGICLGHQIISLALGGKTYKLKFGHRGGNQPVKNLKTGKVEITSQNHSFAVDPDSLDKKVEITHINLNDQTVEGLRHKELPLFSVQYHPESSPGPHDSSYLFDDFIDLMNMYK
ncbi:MAG: glutamine-hydrolyzing carbamoyl-phosphate synthase small subunit [Thermodesulfobacteriota bacterium]